MNAVPKFLFVAFKLSRSNKKTTAKLRVLDAGAVPRLNAGSSDVGPSWHAGVEGFEGERKSNRPTTTCPGTPRGLMIGE